jgi:hypothetical protein
MKRSSLIVAGAALAGAALAAMALPALAQTTPAVGAKVHDDKGKAIGEVVKVIAGPDGRPRQVMVKVERVLRTLPIESLTRQGDGYVSVLSRAEVAALPPSD